MDPSHLTQKSTEALHDAQTKALRFGHTEVDGEHLLLALEDAPEAAVDVRLSFTPDALELHVSGPPAANVDLRAVLAAARERAGLHGGTVDSRLAGGVCYAMARLPLVSGHA